MQKKHQLCSHNFFRKKHKIKLQKKYQSMKYLCRKIQQSYNPIQQLSISNKFQKENPTTQNPQKIKIIQDTTSTQKIKSILQPVFPNKLKIKSYHQDKNYHYDKKIEKQYSCIKKKFMQSARSVFNYHGDYLNHRYHYQRLLNQFVQGKSANERSVYLNNRKISINHQKYRYTKAKSAKQRRKDETSNTFQKNPKKYHEQSQKKQISKYKTLSNNVELSNDKIILKTQPNEHQEKKIFGEEQSNDGMKSHVCMKNNQDNKYQSRSMNWQEENQQDINIFKNTRKEKEKQKQKEKEKQKQKEQWKQNSIIRKNCLFLSSHMLIRSKIAVGDEEYKCYFNELGKAQSTKISKTHRSREPHLGGSNGIQKCQPTKQHYYKLRQQNIKRRNLINIYSRNSTTNKNLSFSNKNTDTNQPNNDNTILTPKQLYLFHQKPTFLIEPW